MDEIARCEYPRPNFKRDQWLCLNGTWEFEFDDQNKGEGEKWLQNHNFTKKIEVPFCYQSKLSGIDDKNHHDYLWYKRIFSLPKTWKNKKIKLNFGAVDYIAKVWINGQFVGNHIGGNTPFSFDITNELKWDDEEEIVVKVEDRTYDPSQARGKQSWTGKPFACWYTNTTGIWQTVWLEPVNNEHIEKIRLTPNIDKATVLIEAILSPEAIGSTLNINIRFEDSKILESSIFCQDRIIQIELNVLSKDFEWGMKLWSPEEPNLYEIFFKLIDNKGEMKDLVMSYFGMRKVSTKGGKFLLNNRPFYQKLVLDQGYFPGSLLTPPSEESIINDIKLTKNFGFNGVRKHQKVEDPLYLYWCDKLGLLVWGEMASFYQFNSESCNQYLREWQEIIDRDYNHPSIVVWTPFNESWGVPNILTDKKQQKFTKSVVNLIKSLDQTRLVVSNDGWEHTETDLCTIHDYRQESTEFLKVYSDKNEVVKGCPAGKFIFSKGYDYSDQPVLITEYGGTAFLKDEGWGYGNKVSSEEEFLQKFSQLTQAIKSIDYIVGYCYTQLTDVEQEMNGLLTYDRRFKIDPNKIKAINDE